jgi:hypothetical protein
MAIILCHCGRVVQPCRIWFHFDLGDHLHCHKCGETFKPNAWTVEHIRRRVVPQAVK